MTNTIDTARKSAKVNAATGPVAVLLPLRALSKYEAAGGPSVDPVADEALFAAIREDLRPARPTFEGPERALGAPVGGSNG